MTPEQFLAAEEAFHAALELAAPAREAFLSALAATSPAVAGEVRALLEADAQAGSFIHAPAVAAAPDSVLQLVAPPGTTVPGARPAPVMPADTPEQLGPYRLLGVLGRGGMGIVYRGEHVVSGEQVAVKTVRMPQVQRLQGLRREIRALARIRHPGIVRILDEGVQDGLPWYAMELLEGTTLEQQLARSGRLTPAVCLQLVQGLCAPLAFLHGEGIVHRDLKPGNILLRDHPVIVDFGISGAGEMGRESLELVSSGSGTIGYMAPEQIRGELVDARADLYALGCILYEMLTGSRPFEGSTAAEVLDAHLYRTPQAPSRRLSPLPPQVDSLVLRLLEKQPRHRFGYASDLASAAARLVLELDGVAASMAPAQLASAASVAESVAPGEPAPWVAASAARAYLYRPGFVGRQTALGELEARLDALGRGRGAVVLVGGESGSGKTRLALELLRTASSRGVVVLLGECLPERRLALQPLRRSLQAIADRCREGGRSESLRVFAPGGKLLVQYEPELCDLPGLAELPEPVELPAEAARERLFACLTATFRAVATEQPLLLVLDDLQWADELTLGWLDALAARAAAEACPPPWLVVGCYRSEDARPVRSRLARLLAAPGFEHLALGRLDAGAVGSMIQDMLALETLPSGFGRFLAGASEGNPFFVAEYLRAAVEHELLWRDAEGRWQLGQASAAPAGPRDYERLPLPRSLRELVERRLEGFDAAARELLGIAAVLGREVDAAVLARVSRTPEAERQEALRELLTRQVLEEPELGRLRFAHDKLREAAYERVPEAARPGLHAAVAESLEALAATDTDELQAVLGHHWSRAGRPDRARPCLLAAARRASVRAAVGEAERLYRAYLSLVERPDAESRHVRNELVGGILLLQGRIDEALAEEQKALATARAHGDLEAEADALLGLGRTLWSASRVAEACTAVESGIEAARAAGSLQLEASGLGRLALFQGEQGRLAGALELHRRSLELWRQHGNPVSIARELSNLAIVHHGFGQHDEARSLYEQALQVLRDSGDRRYSGILLGNLANLVSSQGQQAEAEPLYHEALELHRHSGNLRHEAIVLGNLANAHWLQGRVEESREELEHALAAHREVHNRRHEGNVLTVLAGQLRLVDGDLGQAERLAAQAETLLRDVKDPVELGKTLCEQGAIALASGRSARPWQERAAALAESTGSGPQSPLGQKLARLAAAEAAFQAGDHGQLFRGERLETLDEPLRRWLVESGRLPPETEGGS